MGLFNVMTNKEDKEEQEPQRAEDVCPEKVGKYLIQVSKPRTYHMANKCAVQLKRADCKLYNICEDIYIAFRKVNPQDNPDLINHEIDPNGDWYKELIDVVKEAGPERA